MKLVTPPPYVQGGKLSHFHCFIRQNALQHVCVCETVQVTWRLSRADEGFNEVQEQM